MDITNLNYLEIIDRGSHRFQVYGEFSMSFAYVKGYASGRNYSIVISTVEMTTISYDFFSFASSSSSVTTIAG